MKLYISLMLSAATGLIYEVVATNILFFFFTENTYSIATVLSVFLFGLGIGSYLVYKFKRGSFAVIQVLIALYGFFILYNLEAIIPLIPGSIVLSSFILLLPPAIGLGAIFPLSARLIKKTDVTGLVYFVDLMGAVMGTLIAGFYLIPTLGNQETIIIAVFLNLLAALIMSKASSKVAVVFLAMCFFIFIPQSDTDHFKKPSPYGVVEFIDGTLLIDNRVQCNVDSDLEASERYIVNDTLFQLGGRNLDVMNIGLGCGGTLSEIVSRVDNQVDVVEINPVVVEGNRLNTDILDNPQVNLIIDEGLHYLRNTNKKYDSIILDIENPSVVHSSNLYTLEAFEIIQEHLKPNGIFGIWTYTCSDLEYNDVLYNTLSKAFPYVYHPRHMMMMGSNLPLEYDDYTPATDSTRLNTIDKKELSNIYLKSLK